MNRMRTNSEMKNRSGTSKNGEKEQIVQEPKSMRRIEKEKMERESK
jgi:hypothetical protein